MTTTGLDQATVSHGAPLNRRSFLQIAGGVALTTLAGPAILGAEDKSGTRPVVIGEGDFRFECHHNWGELPAHIRWRNTHGVTIDRDGLIYIKHQSFTDEPIDTIAVFDPQGKFVRSFGAEYSGGGHGIDLREEDGQEFLYLSDTHNRQAIKCDPRGEWVWKLRYPHEFAGYTKLEQFRPTNICFHPDGGFYVGDGYGASYLHEYDAKGAWVRSWGGRGDGPGQLATPHGQWLDDRSGREPAVVVADRANSRLQYFSLAGEPLSILQGVNENTQPHPGEEHLLTRLADYGDFPATGVLPISFPADVDIQGEFMLVPDLHGRVLIFDGQNQLVANLGYDADWTQKIFADNMAMRKTPSQWEAGRFIHPHDACFDKDGNIFVTEWVEAGRVTFLRRV